MKRCTWFDRLVLPRPRVENAARALISAGLLAAAASGPVLADSPQSVTVRIGDTTFSDWTVTVQPGGVVTWVNEGTSVHTATTPGPNTMTSFDTGGLASGQSQSLRFDLPGVYIYSSAPDCLNGNSNKSFNCAATYAVVVPGVPPAGSVVAAANLVPGNFTMAVDDTSGFQPNTITIQAGQSVTFVNRGLNTHSAVSDASAAALFDSGGIGAGQSQTVTFVVPGNYPFHSSTEPIWGHDAFGQTVVTGYVWNGLITVK